MPASRAVLHRCGRCKRGYDADEWQAAEFVGFMDCGTGCTVLLRNCACGSTMGALMLPAPLEVLDEMGKDAA